MNLAESCPMVVWVWRSNAQPKCEAFALVQHPLAGASLLKDIYCSGIDDRLKVGVRSGKDGLTSALPLRIAPGKLVEASTRSLLFGGIPWLATPTYK